MKLQEDEHALMGGKIRLPRELQDLQNEISSLKSRFLHWMKNSSIPYSMEEFEKKKAAVQAELAEAQSVFATKVAGLKGESSSLEKKVENLITERNAAVQNLDAANLENMKP
jgi:predicted  nucleic acid-binding Zn-ribbon protein